MEKRFGEFDELSAIHQNFALQNFRELQSIVSKILLVKICSYSIGQNFPC